MKIITGATFRAGTPTKADHEAHAVSTTDGTRLSAWLLRGRTMMAITLDGERWALQSKTVGHGEPLEGHMWEPDGDELWCPADPATMTPIAWATKPDPSPVMLCERNSRDVAGWRCKRCGAIYGAFWYRLALACCAPRLCDWRDGCAEDAEQGTTFCRTHLPQMVAAAERVSFQAARKITAANYQGWVFCEVDPNHAGEGYYDTADELLRHCRSEGLALPNYAWACHELRASSDAEVIISDALSEHHDDADANISPGQRKALQEFLDEWWRETSVISYVRSRTTVVLLDDTHAADDQCGSCGSAADEACAPHCHDRESPAPSRE